MRIENYLNYLHQHLGLRQVPNDWPLADEPSSEEPQPLDANHEGVNTDNLVCVVDLESESLLGSESSYDRSRSYPALFVRIGAEPASLSVDAEARDLFVKLRSALGFDAESAPWVEIPLNEWQKALDFLRTQTKRILIMNDDQSDKGNSERSEWMIPDPAWMAQNPLLKRPAWELLKEWKSHV